MMRRARRLTLAALSAATVIAGCGGGSGDRNKARAAEYLRVFLLEQDWPQWPEYFASDASLNGSDFPLQIMRGTAEGLAFSFDDIEVEIIEQVAEADRVATLFVIRGRHVRPFNAQPATGQIVALDGFAVDRFSDGKVAESKMILDVWGLARRVAGSVVSPAN